MIFATETHRLFGNDPTAAEFIEFEQISRLIIEIKHFNLYYLSGIALLANDCIFLDSDGTIKFIKFLIMLEFPFFIVLHKRVWLFQLPMRLNRQKLLLAVKLHLLYIQRFPRLFLISLNLVVLKQPLQSIYIFNTHHLLTACDTIILLTTCQFAHLADHRNIFILYYESKIVSSSVDAEVVVKLTWGMRRYFNRSFGYELNDMISSLFYQSASGNHFLIPNLRKLICE